MVDEHVAVPAAAQRGGGAAAETIALRHDGSRLASLRGGLLNLPALVLIPLIVLPLAFLVYGTFRSAPPGQSGVWTLRNFTVLASRGFLDLLVDSAILVVCSTVLAVVVAAALALAITRLGIPLPRFFDAMVVTPAYIPAFVGAIGWSFLLSPKTGYLNAILGRLGLPVLNIFSWWGVILVVSLYSVPIAYLYLRPALLSVDRSMEEAASMLGAGRARTIRTVLFPMVRGALLSATLVVFIHTLGEFAVVGVLGAQAHIDVIPLRIVQLTTSGPVDPGQAAVLGVALAVVAVIGLRVMLKAARRNEFATIGARHNAARPSSRAALRGVGLVACCVYVLFAVVLPIAVLVIGSFQPYLSADFSSGWTLDNYVLMAQFPSAVTSIVNSVVLSIGAAVLCGVLSVILGYLVARRRGWVSTLVNYISTAPLAVPHMVFGVALLWMWVGASFGPYGTRWILLIAYVAMLLPYSMQAATTAFQQVDPVLEEAGRMSGASGFRVSVKIMVPLVAPGILAGSTIVLYHAIQELSASIILYPPGQPVIPVAIWGLVFNGQFAQLFALSVVYIALILLLVTLLTWLGRRYGRLV